MREATSPALWPPMPSLRTAYARRAEDGGGTARIAASSFDSRRPFAERPPARYRDGRVPVSTPTLIPQSSRYVMTTSPTRNRPGRTSSAPAGGCPAWTTPPSVHPAGAGPSGIGGGAAEREGTLMTTGFFSSTVSTTTSVVILLGIGVLVL